MTKLSDHGWVEQKAGEVNIVFDSKVPYPAIKNLVNECSQGKCSCNCGPLLAKVEGISAEEGPKGAVIHLKGERVGAQEVEEHFKQCNVSVPTDLK